MSIKDIAKHAIAAATTHIAKVDADHDRLEWLDKLSHDERWRILEALAFRVRMKYGTDGSVREGIDFFRKKDPDRVETVDGKFDTTEGGDA